MRRPRAFSLCMLVTVKGALTIRLYAEKESVHDRYMARARHPQPCSVHTSLESLTVGG